MVGSDGGNGRVSVGVRDVVWMRFHRATSAIESFTKRDEVESAANHIRAVSDMAYFYSGLAFGITLAELTQGSSRVR
jgi:hypothetical protein